MVSQISRYSAILGTLNYKFMSSIYLYVYISIYF